MFSQSGNASRSLAGNPASWKAGKAARMLAVRGRFLRNSSSSTPARQKNIPAFQKNRPAATYRRAVRASGFSWKQRIATGFDPGSVPRGNRSEERRVGSDWSSDVCSSDLIPEEPSGGHVPPRGAGVRLLLEAADRDGLRSWLCAAWKQIGRAACRE